MTVLDALKAFWVLGVFLSIFLWLPALLFSNRPNSSKVIRILGNGVRLLLCVTVLVFLLSSLRVFGAVTAVVVLLAAIAVGWFRKYVGTPDRLLKNLQAVTVNLVSGIESGSLGLSLPALRQWRDGRQLARARIRGWRKRLKGKELLSACFVLVLGMTVILHTEHAVRELRFDQAEQYSALLRARQLILNIHPADRPFVFPAIVATTSLLSTADCTQVTRFLTPAIGLFVVLAAGLLIHVSAHARVASLAVIYCLGGAAFPVLRAEPGVTTFTMQKIKALFVSSPTEYRDRPELVLGILFVLLGLLFLADWHKTSRDWNSLLDFGCCLLLTAIVSQALLVLLLISASILLVRPMMGPLVFAAGCSGLMLCTMFFPRISIPDEIHAIVPVPLAIFVACFLALVEACLRAVTRTSGEPLLLAVCVCVAVLWYPPQRFPGRFLEYEAAARATQEIAYGFPRQTWVVAAPVEQLAETFGLGGHEDLAGFVEKYRNQVSNPEFRFSDAREELFVYVEKKPFQIFSREPDFVSFSVLSDATYRNYRSPGGRASLEAAALQLCENYRQSHSNADVFFENDDLRIYHIHSQQTSEAQTRQ